MTDATPPNHSQSFSSIPGPSSNSNHGSLNMGDGGFNSPIQPPVKKKHNSNFFTQFVDSLKNKNIIPRKTSVGMVFGVLIFALLLTGSAAAFMLSQFSQDVRQQASSGYDKPKICTTVGQCIDNCFCKEVGIAPSCASQDQLRCSQACEPNTCVNGKWCEENGQMGNFDCGKDCGNFKEGECNDKRERCVNGEWVYNAGCSSKTGCEPNTCVNGKWCEENGQVGNFDCGKDCGDFKEGECNDKRERCVNGKWVLNIGCPLSTKSTPKPLGGCETITSNPPCDTVSGCRWTQNKCITKAAIPTPSAEKKTITCQNVIIKNAGLNCYSERKEAEEGQTCASFNLCDECDSSCPQAVNEKTFGEISCVEVTKTTGGYECKNLKKDLTSGQTCASFNLCDSCNPNCPQAITVGGESEKTPSAPQDQTEPVAASIRETIKDIPLIGRLFFWL